MNILVLHSSSDLYGASKILLHTVSYLSKRKHIIIVVLSEEGPLADLIRREGCVVHIIKLGILRRKYLTLSGLVNRFKTIKKAKRILRKIIGDNHVDIVYSNTTSVLAGAFLVRKMNVKHVWHIHEIITQRWLLKILGWIVNRYGDKIIVVSNAAKEHWKSYVDENKLYVVYNGLDYERYLTSNASLIRQELGLSKNDILVGMIGRVHPWKGQTYFLNIAKQLAETQPNVKFVMVGDVYPGNEYLYDEIEKTKCDLGIKNQIIDLGYRKDVPEILSALDIFILPSIAPDPLPTVILEAMAAGKPVIATAHGGSVEMVQDNVSGFLIPWNDSLKASKIILPLIENKPLREAMGLKGRQRVQSLFSREAYFENMGKIIFSEGEQKKSGTLPHG